MKTLLTILSGLALLGQGNLVSAQARVSGNQGLEQLFSTITRSAVVSDDPPTTTGKKDGERQVLLRASCERVMRKSIRLIWLNDRNGKMKLQLRGIYTQGTALYFLLRMKNGSAQDYEVQAIHFFITDGSGKRVPPVRKGELRPVYVYDSTTLVPGYSRLTNVIVLPRFTLPPGRRLLIEVLEKNGGRQLQLLTNHFTFGRAQSL